MEANLFSIVIPCKNEEKMIGKTLGSISKQNIVNSYTPIIIADAKSTDRTVGIIRNFQHDLNITITNGGLPPLGRNNGARYVNTKYILFMDADVRLGSTDTLRNILNTAEQEELDLVIPKIKIDQAGWRDKFFEYLYYAAAKSKLLGAFGTGMFICIKNDVFRSLGAFNENLPLGDDWELTHKIKRNRFALANATVFTSNRRFNTLGYFSTYYMWVSVALNKSYRDKGHVEYFRPNHQKQTEKDLTGIRY